MLGYQSRLVAHNRLRGKEKKEITHEQRFHMVSDKDYGGSSSLSFLVGVASEEK